MARNFDSETNKARKNIISKNNRKEKKQIGGILNKIKSGRVMPDEQDDQDSLF